MRRVLPLVTALVPLAIAPGVFFYFDVTPKVVLLLAASAALLWVQIDLTGLLKRQRGVWFATLLSLQLASLAAATLLSTNAGISLMGSTWRRYGFITQASILVLALIGATRVACDAQAAVPLLRAVVIAGIAAASYGCAQYFGVDPWLPAAAYHIGEGEFSIVRPPSTLGHASYAASFYLQAVFAGIAVAIQSRSRTWRFAGWAAAALGTVAIVFSGTRGAMVGFVAGGVMLALLFRPKLTARHLGLTAVILIAGAVFYAAPTGEKLRARTRWSAEDPRGGARLTLWRDAAQMGAMHWASGWGPETFVTEFPHYQSRELARQFPDFYHESPHNIFLEAWTAQGIFGLLIMAGFCACALRTVGGSPVQRCLFGGFVALAVSLQFVSFTAPSAFGLYLMLGLLVALDPVDRQSAAYSLPRSVALPASCVALVYAVQLTATDTLLESSRQVLQAGFVAKAEADYGRAKAFQWVGPTSDLWFARALLESTANLPNPMARATTLEIARQAGEHATLRSEDRQNAFYTLAQISSLRDDLPGVEKNLRFAIASAPMWFKPHWMLAETLSLAGRQAEARAQAEVALDLDAGKDPEVRETWLRISGGPASK